MSLIKPQDLDPSAVIIKNNRRFIRFLQKKENETKKMIGKYRIGAKLGEGSHGYVYKATNSQNQKIFAVKILPRSQINQSKVQTQINIHTSLRHQNIVKIQQVIKTEDKIFIFLEFCQKGDLFEFIKNNGQMKEETAALIFIKIYSALLYIHSLGIAHRDIKAQNILLDKDMNPKLSDFGLAKTYNKNSQYLLTVCGSLNYTAPQILKKIKYKASLVDLWSLCVTLYLVLTGNQPFNIQNNKNITKLKIVSFQWPRNAQISQEALQLFDSVFVPYKSRIKLQQIKSTRFFNKYSYFFIEFQQKNHDNLNEEKKLNYNNISTQEFSQNIIESNQEKLLFSQLNIKSENIEKQMKRKLNLQNYLNQYIIDSQKRANKSRKQIKLQNDSKHQLAKLFHTTGMYKQSKSVEHSYKFRVRKSLHKNLCQF